MLFPYWIGMEKKKAFKIPIGWKINNKLNSYNNGSVLKTLYVVRSCGNQNHYGFIFGKWLQQHPPHDRFLNTPIHNILSYSQK